jgi:hypothetical protein
MHEFAKKAVRNLIPVTATVAVLLVVDMLLWFVPGVVTMYQQNGVQSQCDKLKPGQTRTEALDLIHQSMTPQREREEEKQGETAGHTIVFGTGNESCTVELDPLKGTVIATKYEHSDFAPLD